MLRVKNSFFLLLLVLYSTCGLLSFRLELFVGWLICWMEGLVVVVVVEWMSGWMVQWLNGCLEAGNKYTHVQIMRKMQFMFFI